MLKLLASTLLVACAAGAQWSGDSSERRAEIRGGGGGDSGKCTLEADVDGVAEIDIRGDRARIRTLSGNPASLKRFQCDAVMPSNPSDFRFRGVDGRGRQQLVSSPSGRGSAVVRIEDPKGGSEGYTFDIEWRGTGSGSGSGWGSGGSGGSGSGWGGGSSGSGSGWGGSGSGSGWGGSSNELRYSGSGSGSFSNANGLRDEIRSCRVYIDRNGNAEVVFRTDKYNNVTLKGRVTGVNGNRINADMSGNGISGNMGITSSGSNRVSEIRMSGSNPVRFDLHWRD